MDNKFQVLLMLLSMLATVIQFNYSFYNASNDQMQSALIHETPVSGSVIRRRWRNVSAAGQEEPELWAIILSKEFLMNVAETLECPYFHDQPR